jgi:hypothetical protein
MKSIPTTLHPNFTAVLQLQQINQALPSSNAPSKASISNRSSPRPTTSSLTFTPSTNATVAKIDSNGSQQKQQS